MRVGRWVVAVLGADPCELPLTMPQLDIKPVSAHAGTAIVCGVVVVMVASAAAAVVVMVVWWWGGFKKALENSGSL